MNAAAGSEICIRAIRDRDHVLEGGLSELARCFLRLAQLRARPPKPL